MTSAYEPVLHALSLAPRVARPGETVRIVFRTRNLGTLPSPPGTVSFMIPAGLEAAGATEIEVDPVEPGAELVAEIAVRATAPVADRTALAVQAALQLPDAVLGTNACTLVVRSRAALDGAASGVFVDAIDSETVRVRAVVTNEGDGPACGLRVVVPAPNGCVRTDGDGAATLDVERLDAGGQATLEFEARITAPRAEIRADDGEVRFGDGRRCALPARDALSVQPVLLPPRARAVASRRRIDVAIDVQNDGWADARDVRVRFALPAALRLVEGSVFVDDVPAATRGPRRSIEKFAFARLERSGAAHAVVISAVAARATVRVALSATVPGGYAGGTLAIGAGSHEVDVPFVPEPVRELRVRLHDVAQIVAPGEVVLVDAEVVNAGDVPETVIFGIMGERVALAGDRGTCTIPAGSRVAVALNVRAADGAPDESPASFAVIVSDCDGERARAESVLLVRNRAWLEVDEPPVRDGERITYTVRNVGATAAQDVVVVFGAAAVSLGAIAPHASAQLSIDERYARLGGVVRRAEGEPVAIAPADDRTPAVVYAALQVPGDVLAGATFTGCAQLDVEDAVETLAFRVPVTAGASYVPGSTRIDERALLDRAGASPLDGGGLIVRDIPGGTRVSIAWSLLADSALDDEDVAIGAFLDVDGVTQPLAPRVVRVAARDAFAARPTGLPYHVEACTVGNRDAEVPSATSDLEPNAHGEPEPAPQSAALERRVQTELAEKVAPREPSTVEQLPVLAHDDAFAFTVALDERRHRTIVRLLDGAPAGGLVAHVLAMRAFFPDREASGHVAVATALAAVDSALRDVFDRLFVKLRLPGFTVTADDLDDPVLRGALGALLERLRDAPPRPTASRLGAPASRLARDRIAELLASLADAPYGASAALRALVAFAPTHSDDDPLLGAALARYAIALDDVLSRYDGVPLEILDDALAHGSDRALDDARADVLAALRSHAAPAEVAC